MEEVKDDIDLNLKNTTLEPQGFGTFKQTFTTQESIKMEDQVIINQFFRNHFGELDLESEKDNDLRSVRDSSGNSILHLAVTNSQPKIVEILLKDERINLNVRNNSEQTPLHLFHCDKEKQNRNYPDHKSLDVLLAFKSGLHDDDVINAQDKNGNTSLHLAVKHKCTYCMQKLLSYGADFNIRSEDYQTYFVTPGIFNEYPWAGDILESRLNNAVSYDRLTENENLGESRVLMDFGKVVSKTVLGETNQQPRREMEFLETILLANRLVRKQIFSHPLVSCFVFFKSERVRWIFILSLILHVLLATVYTIYTLTVYLSNCPYKQNNSEENLTSVYTTLVQLTSSGVCDKGLGSVGYSVFLLIVAGILGFLEIMKFLQNKYLYLKTWSNFFQVIMIVCMCLTVWPVKWTSHKSLYNWQYSASAYGIFHVWSTMMINVGRFPRLGIYVEMFGKVLRNFGYLMLAYIFLMIAFSISFCLIFPDYPPFETIPRAVLKVITMMSGEVDYGDFFYGDHKGQETGDFIFKKSESADLIHPVTAHLLYGAFVILVTIVLTNLLIGLAVDDIKALQQDAEFTKSTREIANMAYLESVIFWNWIPSDCRFVKWLRRSVFLGRLEDVKTQRKGSFCEVLIERVANNFLCKKIFHSPTPPKNDKTNPQSDTLLPMYSFGVSQVDCKPPRCFPEDILLRTIDLMKSKDSTEPESSTKVFQDQYCRRCKCVLGSNF